MIYHSEENKMKEIKTFTDNSWIAFDKTAFNLKGVKYTFNPHTKSYRIEPNSYHLIDKQIPNYIMDNLILKGGIVLGVKGGING